MGKILTLGLSDNPSIERAFSSEEKGNTLDLTDKLRAAIRPSLRKAIYAGIASVAILFALEAYTQGYRPTQSMLNQGFTASGIRKAFEDCRPYYLGGEIARDSAYVQARAGSEIALFEQKAESNITLLKQYISRALKNKVE